MFFLHANNSNSTISRLHLQGTSYSGAIMISSAAETLRNITYKNLWIENPKGMKAKWCKLTYNEENCITQDSTIEGADKEHLIYNHSPRGFVVMSNLDLRNAGAQAYQETWRLPESDDPNGYLNVGATSLRNCRILMCGQPRGYGRAS